MTEKVIEVKRLNHSYPDGVQALKDVTLDVRKGDSVGIIGPNGAGKSTLLLHLNGILKSNSSVEIFGLKPVQENLPAIRKKVGLIFQDPDDQLFMPTVFDDVAFGPLNLGENREQVQKTVPEALKKVEMSHAISKIPHHLSFGEKRRVSIATVLSMNPEVLLLDEPSSNLDPHSRRNLINFLNGLEVTKIIASHDMELILDICKRVILLDEGKIIADGDTREILRNKVLIESHRLESPLSLTLKNS